MSKLGMVLEGGGVRGIYTAGVLDYFLEQGITVDSIYGVSAGALHGVNFVSNQKQRSYRVGTIYAKDKRYLGLHSLIHTGDIFGADFCYHELPDKLEIYDYDAFLKNPTKFYATVSNLDTGKAEYILIEDMHKDIEYVRASASLPLVSRTVEVKGQKYLDGGICDSIPLQASMNMGHDKNIVVLTRPDGYVKEPNKMFPLIRKKYREYPNFVEAAKNRHIYYNQEVEFVREQEAAKNVFVLRPSQNLSVKRLEKNVDKIKELYQLGIHDAKTHYEELKKFLEEQ